MKQKNGLARLFGDFRKKNFSVAETMGRFYLGLIVENNPEDLTAVQLMQTISILEQMCFCNYLDEGQLNDYKIDLAKKVKGFELVKTKKKKATNTN